MVLLGRQEPSCALMRAAHLRQRKDQARSQEKLFSVLVLGTYSQPIQPW